MSKYKFLHRLIIRNNKCNVNECKIPLGLIIEVISDQSDSPRDKEIISSLSYHGFDDIQFNDLKLIEWSSTAISKIQEKAESLERM